MEIAFRPSHSAQRLVISRAAAADAPMLGEIYRAAWRETHAGTPLADLAEAAAAERDAFWAETLASASRAVFIVAERGETPSGVAACGPVASQKLAAAGYAGEFYLIYLRRRLQGRGVGRELMRIMARRLLALGLDSAGLWALRDSPGARRFYERLGAQPAGVAGVWPLAGRELADVAYGWRDVRVILDHQ